MSYFKFFYQNIFRSRVLFIAACFAYSSVFSFICPKTYRSIQVGDSEETVRAVCGEPQSKTSKQVLLKDNVQLDVWQYQAKRYVDPKRNGRRVDVPQVTFILLKNKIIDLQVGGIRTATVSACGQQFSKDQAARTLILSACGQPAYQTIQTQLISKGRTTASTWIYQFGTYQPQKILKFYDGKLATIH